MAGEPIEIRKIFHEKGEIWDKSFRRWKVIFSLTEVQPISGDLPAPRLARGTLQFETDEDALEVSRAEGSKSLVGVTVQAEIDVSGCGFTVIGAVRPLSPPSRGVRSE